MLLLGAWPILATGGGGAVAARALSVGRCTQFSGVYHSTGTGPNRIAAGHPGPVQRRTASGVQQAGGRHGMTCGLALDGRNSRFARVGHQTGLKYSRLCALSTI